MFSLVAPFLLTGNVCSSLKADIGFRSVRFVPGADVFLVIHKMHLTAESYTDRWSQRAQPQEKHQQIASPPWNELLSFPAEIA